MLADGQKLFAYNFSGYWTSAVESVKVPRLSVAYVLIQIKWFVLRQNSYGVYVRINTVPEYVLVLSGDHIYKMDYAQMLSYHKEKGADCTIAVINVSLEEASRFGIMNTNPDNSVYEFAEKPKQPKSTNASMGIYIFNWAKLRKYLIEDEADKTSQNDFGKNIIVTRESFITAFLPT